jgi:hypothetical protein
MELVDAEADTEHVMISPMWAFCVSGGGCVGEVVDWLGGYVLYSLMDAEIVWLSLEETRVVPFSRTVACPIALADPPVVLCIISEPRSTTNVQGVPLISPVSGAIKRLIVD